MCLEHRGKLSRPDILIGIKAKDKIFVGLEPVGYGLVQVFQKERQRGMFKQFLSADVTEVLLIDG